MNSFRANYTITLESFNFRITLQHYGTHTRSGITEGVEAHKAGKAQEADRYYTAILKANPKHSDANHNKSYVGVNKVEEALPFLNRFRLILT